VCIVRVLHAVSWFTSIPTRSHTLDSHHHPISAKVIRAVKVSTFSIVHSTTQPKKIIMFTILAKRVHCPVRVGEIASKKRSWFHSNQ